MEASWNALLAHKFLKPTQTATIKDFLLISFDLISPSDQTGVEYIVIILAN